MNPEVPVQAQLDACNARDLARLAAHRFNLPKLHAELINRIVLGNKVVDHERICGVRDEPFEAAVVFEVSGALISKVCFFDAN